jgi:hypothetical protein
MSTQLPVFIFHRPTQLAPYYNTVAELRAEYEMNMRKREQEKLLAMTHPEVICVLTLSYRLNLTSTHKLQGRLELHVDATELFQPDEYAQTDELGQLQ